jgi:diaminopimelate decarboxylase
VEPGDPLSGPAVSIFITVEVVKDILGVRKYITVDGGMGDNPRPALYQSRYEAVWPTRQAGSRKW